ncbi:MAG TPA: zinc ribbon domain-containing protein [Phycisphaerales bacterium]|nr:zinc ribbon domain-containing protein [Phycisphaerales bacterium]HMP37397.1 zinc ribbon domain-containing protein [Phycisphaerales bacterium]
MPTYDYRCNACGHEFEQFQSITAPVIRKCPACGKLKLERLIGTGAGIIFKGGGFYETDYRSEAYRKAAEAERTVSTPKTEGPEKPEKPEKSAPETPPRTGEAKAEAGASRSTADGAAARGSTPTSGGGSPAGGRSRAGGTTGRSERAPQPTPAPKRIAPDDSGRARSTRSASSAKPASGSKSKPGARRRK